jgi:hypothetical protein
MQDRAEQLSAEALEITTRNQTVARLSNLALQLYSWYTRHGHARNEKDEEGVKEFLSRNLPPDVWEQKGFYERLYLYQSMSWYAFIRQDFLMYYRYAQKWVDLFHQQKLMIRVETGHYIKGLHNLLNAHFDLRNFRAFEQTLRKFEEFSRTDRVQDHDNFRIQAFIYTASAKINQHFMMGTFREGLLLVPDIEQKLKEYAIFLDSHRVMVMNYKIATLYFGNQDYKTSIDYLQKIIYEDEGLGNDLQCYARLVHLMSHYELGNDSIIESLTKSVYRFMAKMQNGRRYIPVFKKIMESLPPAA